MANRKTIRINGDIVFDTGTGVGATYINALPGQNNLLLNGGANSGGIGGDVRASAGDGDTGGNIILTGGDSATSAGGDIQVTAGAFTGTGPIAAGAVTISAGVSADGNGGDATLSAGNSTAFGDGGTLNLDAGDALSVGDGGGINIHAGTGDEGAGGSIDLVSGSTFNDAGWDAGYIALTTGNGYDGGLGGYINLHAGTGGSAVTFDAGDGGTIDIKAGNGGAGSAGNLAGPGGDISIRAGGGGADGGFGGAGGGSVKIDAGTGDVNGSINIGTQSISTLGTNTINIGRTDNTTKIQGDISIGDTTPGQYVTFINDISFDPAQVGVRYIRRGSNTSGAGDDLMILAGYSTTELNNGGNLALHGGTGGLSASANSPGAGGDSTLVGGTGGTTDLSATGGTGGIASVLGGTGGEVTLGGSSATSGSGGDVNITGGSAGLHPVGSGNIGGDVYVQGGLATTSLLSDNGKIFVGSSHTSGVEIGSTSGIVTIKAHNNITFATTLTLTPLTSAPTGVSEGAMYVKDNGTGKANELYVYLQDVTNTLGWRLVSVS